MTTFISILRGINVSGQKLIKMDDLRKLYEGLGFRKVTTYVQSGNVIFQWPSIETDNLERMISQEIQKNFGFEVPVIVLTITQLRHIIENNPFPGDTEKDPSYMHITFLASKPGEYDRGSIASKKQGEEEISFTEEVVYLYCPHGYGKTKLTNTFLESRLKVIATTRNWKTTNEIFNIASQIN